MSASRTGVDQDPIEYFLEDITFHGKTARTRQYYERVLREFEAHVREETTSECLSSVDHRTCMGYIHGLRDTKSELTVATYASYLNHFYSYMIEVGDFETNPMTLVIEEMDESIHTDPARRDISIPQMRSFVATINHPLERAVVITLLKTGIRAGELCNLDLRDLHLSDDSPHNWDVRGTLQNREASLFIPAKPARGEETNGETRTASNKRKRDTTIPVDLELEAALTAWLAIRPDSQTSARPLFVSTSGKWGTRLTPDMVHHIVEQHARPHGWYADGGGASENVTPHYFRHFFTTHMRERTGDSGVVKYLRGDVAQDVIDTYTHEWGDIIENVYLNNIYSLTS
jgi:site-specific recombinase XerD